MGRRSGRSRRSRRRRRRVGIEGGDGEEFCGFWDAFFDESEERTCDSQDVDEDADGVTRGEADEGLYGVDEEG